MKGFKSFLKGLAVVLILICVVVAGGAAAIYYENLEKDMKENSGDSKLAQFLVSGGETQKKEEPLFTCLFMGRNAHLTDFMMLAQYNPNTREVSLMSIPRDTYVGTSSVDGKINSIYMYKYPEKVVKAVEEITGVDIQHYLIFNAKILRNIVNELGGVTVTVPFNMNYDDPDQNLYIHLKKGTQRLSGAQAEQFVRFRKNNNGGGYANGDVGRIATQQKFIKAMISEVLKVENIGKVGNLVKIALNGTDTDLTLDVLQEYLDDVVTFKKDRVRIETLPGVGKYGKGPDGLTRSFFYHDAEKTKEVVKELFFTSIDDVNSSGDSATSGDKKNDINTKAQEVISKGLETESGNNDEKIRIEVLNANAKTSKMNDLVEKLNSNDCNVVKIGNYPTTKVESSRIITYGKQTSDELEKIKSLSGIKNVEESDENVNVKFTIIIGANY